jgi:hypothetical protein
MGTPTSQVSVSKIERSNQSQSLGSPVATIAGEVGANVVREAMPKMGTYRVELAGKNDLELAEQAEDEVDDEFWVAASNIIGIRETQPLGDVVSNTNMGKARIVHQAMPSMMDALNVAVSVAVESGHEVIDDLHAREIRVENEGCSTCDMGGFMSSNRYLRVFGDIVACGCSGGSDIVNSNDSVATSASRDCNGDAVSDAPANQEPDDESLDVTDIFLKDPTQTKNAPPKHQLDNGALAVFMDLTQSKDATNHSPETDVKVIVPCDASTDAPAIQEPNYESLKDTDAIFTNPTQAEDAPSPVVTSLQLNRFYRGQKQSLLDIPDERRKVIVSTNQTQTENALSHLHAVKPPMFEGLHHVHTNSSAPRRSKLRQDDTSVKTSKSQLSKYISSVRSVIKTNKHGFLKPLLDVPDESRPDHESSKEPTEDAPGPVVMSLQLSRFHRGQKQSLLDSLDESRKVAVSTNPTQAGDAPNHRYAVKPPKFEGLHHVHAHSSTRFRSKLRKDDTSVKTSKSQLSKYISSVRSVIKSKKKSSNDVSMHVVETNSPGGHTAKKRKEKKRSMKSKKKRGKFDPVPLMLSDEIVLLRGMISQLQGKINKVDQLENTDYYTGCFNEYLEWFASCSGGDDGSAVTKTSSNDTVSIREILGSLSKSTDEPLYLV